ncbi:MAG TPA: exodeoxyribonuclease VII large subunit [bacterium]
MSQLTFDEFLEEKTCYSVSALTREIRFLLESSFPEIWVQGEISNFSRHSSGHMYFSLRDDKAQISCVMWQSRNQNLFFTPQDGMKVLVQGLVTVFEKRGAYQLNVLQLQPAGVGELQLAFEQLKYRLHEEGLFAAESKKPIPRYPQRVGIVTSPTGAAIRDLVSILQRRFPALEIILNPVRVQGKEAALEIARAIDEFNEYGDVDVVIVGRGGGSLEDLWAFNEEIVARAVFRSEIPVVSAVGHEVDFTICDFVADLRAPTPSAAAELVAPSREEISSQLRSYRENMRNGILNVILHFKEKLQRLRTSYGFRQPLDLVRQHAQRLDETGRSLQRLLTHQVALCKEKLHGLNQRLILLDHNNVLQRGYSICLRRTDRKIISQAAVLKPHESIEINFYRGKVIGTVDEIEP